MRVLNLLLVTILLSTAQLLGAVLALLNLLAGLRDGSGKAHADQPVLGLELLGCIKGIVDETEPGRLATSEVGAEVWFYVVSIACSEIRPSQSIRRAGS